MDGFLRDTSCPSWLKETQFAVPLYVFLCDLYGSSWRSLRLESFSLLLNNNNRKVKAAKKTELEPIRG
jgi:hypothetical protein